MRSAAIRLGGLERWCQAARLVLARELVDQALFWRMVVSILNYS
jgi:hypothetical protein